jgi:hypothetical protein
LTDVDTRPDGTETDERNNGTTGTTETAENAPGAQLDANTDERADGDTFPRSYVEKLRTESAGYRDRAKTAEERAEALAKRLHAELVRANGTLVDPEALAFDAEHLDDAEKLSAAIEALTNAKPYLKARKATGDAGQGPRGDNKAAPTFADLFA